MQMLMVDLYSGYSQQTSIVAANRKEFVLKKCRQYVLPNASLHKITEQGLITNWAEWETGTRTGLPGALRGFCIIQK